MIAVRIGSDSPVRAAKNNSLMQPLGGATMVMYGSMGAMTADVRVGRRVRVFLLGMLVAACALACAPVAADAAGTGTIEGTVTSAASGQGIGYVEVCAIETSSRLYEGCAETEADGSYEIEGLAPGSYKVYFIHWGCPKGECRALNFLDQYYGGGSEWSQAGAIVTLGPGQSRTGIDAALQPGAEVSGTVTDGAELPIEYGGVCVFEAASGEIYECEETGSSGSYAMKGLPGGAYKVGFSHSCCGEAFLQFSPDQGSFGTAHLVALAAGQSTSGIDARLVGGTISGTVQDVSHAPIENVEVCAELRGDEYTYSCEETNSEGRYEITWLPAGEYDVFFYAGGYAEQVYDEQTEEAKAEAVTVALGQTTTGIDATLNEGGQITGTVTNKKGEPIESGIGCAFEEIEGYVREVNCGGFNSSGEYTIEHLAEGSYKVGFYTGIAGLAPGYYEDAGSLAAAKPVPVSVGETISKIDGQLGEEGKIAGTLKLPNGEGAAYFEVCAYEPGRSGEFVECNEANEDGEYELVRLSAAEYEVAVSEGGCDVFVCGPSPYEPLIESKVQVTEGSTTEGVNARLQVGAAISGTIADALTGRPAEGELCALEAGSEAASAVASCMDLHGQHGFRSGEYRLQGLPAGTYKIVLWPEGRNYAPEQFYGGQSFASAAAVSVPAAGSASANFSLTELFPAQPVNTAAPVLSGSPSVGQTLSCSQGGWAAAQPTSYSYAWQRDGGAIAGQSGSTYLVGAADEGKALTCVVSAINAAGSASAVSNSLSVSANVPPPVVKKEKHGAAVAARVARVKHGKARVKLSCTGAGACKGQLKLIAKVVKRHVVRRHGKRHVRRTVRRVTIGSAHFSIAKGESKTVAVKLTGEGRALLAKAGKHGLKVRLAGKGVEHRHLLLQLARKHKHGKYSHKHGKQHRHKHGK